MEGRVAALFRHPVKSVGREKLEAVELEAGCALPMDRVWAVTHGRSRFDFAARIWAPCGNFLRVASSPRLAAVEARLAGARLRLTHPEAEPWEGDPEADGQALADWAGALAGERQPGPYRLARAAQALTDAAEPLITLGNLASLRALSERMGRPLDPARFRCNVWLEGLDPWEERGWREGDALRLGAARLRVDEPVQRCRATEANPETGARDAAVLEALREATGAAEFTIYAGVTVGGRVALGDALSTP
jgi:uncharacterized protein YcbX